MFATTSDAISSSSRAGVAALGDEQIETELRTWAADLAAGEAYWMLLIAEFDRRKSWTGWGIQSCAHWLAWRCGLSLPSARERVRVARALTQLPQVQARFSAGELSYSKVRALTRVAEPETEDALLTLAGNATAAQLDRIVAAWRRVDRDNDADCHESRYVKFHHADDGALVGSFRIPPDQAPVFREGLDRFTEAATPRSRQTDDSDFEPIDRRRADGLVAMAEAAELGRSRSGAQRHLVRVEVSSDVLCHDADGTCRIEQGPAIAAETARRLCCDSTIVVVAVDPSDGEIVAESQPTASIPRATRRALRRRDGDRCRFDGCESTLSLHAHHIVHRAHGGSHDVHNLLTLCRFHHHLVHEGGFTIEHLGAGGVAFDRPDGTRLDPPQPMTGKRETVCQHNIAQGLRIGHRTLHAGIGERMDLHHIIFVLAHNTQLRRDQATQTVTAAGGHETHAPAGASGFEPSATLVNAGRPPD